MLTFMVGSKQAFEVSLADVSQTQMQGKTDVLLEFHVDDTTGANEVRKHPLTVSASPSKVYLVIYGAIWHFLMCKFGADFKY
jgi:hypothetical protein